LTEEKPSLAELKAFILIGAEMFVVAEYLHILPLTEVKFAINIHPTLLPKGRGPTPLPYLIRNPESSGVTIHKLSDLVDAGDIIIQSKVVVSEDESITTLMVKMHIESLHLIKIFFANIDKNYDSAIPQLNHSYWPQITLLERTLDWHLSARQIKLLARTFGVFGLVVKLDDILYRVCHLDIVEYEHTYVPGDVIIDDENLIVVSCLDGIVCLHKISLFVIKRCD
jgi:methionyl-tRNA formyltransferase